MLRVAVCKFSLDESTMTVGVQQYPMKQQRVTSSMITSRSVSLRYSGLVKCKQGDKFVLYIAKGS